MSGAEPAARLPLPPGRRVRGQGPHTREVPRRQRQHDLRRGRRPRPGRAAARDPRARRGDVRGGDRQGSPHGVLDPRLFILMDEAANIAPVRNLAPWLSQCGDHGIVIATIWQSIAQIDQRYGRAARDAICAASTAQVFIPPLAEPTSAGYLTELLGEEPVANASSSTGLARHTLEHRPSEGRALAVAEADRPRARDPRLPRPAARDRARARMVRGPPVRALRPAARGTRPCRNGVALSPLRRVRVPASRRMQERAATREDSCTSNSGVSLATRGAPACRAFRVSGRIRHEYLHEPPGVRLVPL